MPSRPPERARIPGSARSHDFLMAALSEYFTLRSIPHFRINQRPVLTKNGWRTPGADPGTPDIVACLDGGVALLVEAKTGGADLSPVQLRVRRQWEKRGAWFCVARSVDDVVSVMASWDDLQSEQRAGGFLGSLFNRGRAE